MWCVVVAGRLSITAAAGFVGCLAWANGLPSLSRNSQNVFQISIASVCEQSNHSNHSINMHIHTMYYYYSFVHLVGQK